MLLRQSFSIRIETWEKKVAKRNIHYIGILANVDRSVTGLRINDKFTIEYKSNDDIAPFLRKIDKHYGLQKGLGISPRGSYCVVGADIDQFEATPQGVAMRPSVLNKTHELLQDRCRLLRLFKEGNVTLAYSFLYHLADANGEPKPFAFGREQTIEDTTLFALATDEISEAESFMNSHHLPLAEPFLQLALESFELSYEAHDAGLAFLSLMTSMEVLLNPSNHELRYRVSRNAATLLGQDRSEGETIFREMRGLYDKRSKFVHSGNRSLVMRDDVLKLREYVRMTLKEGMGSGLSKDDLLRTLNTCGFGERLWRTDA